MREDRVGERLGSRTKRVGHSEELGGGPAADVAEREKDHVQGPKPRIKRLDRAAVLRGFAPPSLACNPHGSKPSSRFFFSFLNSLTVPVLKFRFRLVNSGPKSVP
jgi:hypothetical protein